MHQDEIKEFYDNFLHSQMLKYRIKGNERIDRAIELISSYTKMGDNVLDVGCGIGIISESIARQVGPDGYVLGFDISKRNIWYANETVSSDNVALHQANLLTDQEKIRKLIGNKRFDVIYFVDVIEHIPLEKHPEVFQFLGELISDRAFIIFTYPTAQYQQYLRDHEREKLQVIDEDVTVDHMIEMADNIGFSLKYYSILDMWKNHNQYVHCVFGNDNAFKPDVPKSKSVTTLISEASRDLLDLAFRHPYRRFKYVKRVFGNNPDTD